MCRGDFPNLGAISQNDFKSGVWSVLDARQGKIQECMEEKVVWMDF